MPLSWGHMVSGMHSPLSPWVLSGTCLGPLLARGQFPAGCWAHWRCRSGTSQRRKGCHLPLLSPASHPDSPSSSESWKIRLRCCFAKGSEWASKAQCHWLPKWREKQVDRAYPLTGLSYFAGAADKAGTRENQVGWELLFAGKEGRPQAWATLEFAPC